MKFSFNIRLDLCFIYFLQLFHPSSANEGCDGSANTFYDWRAAVYKCYATLLTSVDNGNENPNKIEKRQHLSNKEKDERERERKCKANETHFSNTKFFNIPMYKHDES